MFDLPRGFAVIDWAFCGIGALGEDAGVLVADALFDGAVDPVEGEALAVTVWEGYAAGLAEAGPEADLAAARYGFLAATPLRYCWMPWRTDGPGRDVRPLDDVKRERWRQAFALLEEWWREAGRLPSLP